MIAKHGSFQYTHDDFHNVDHCEYHSCFFIMAINRIEEFRRSFFTLGCSAHRFFSAESCCPGSSSHSNISCDYSQLHFALCTFVGVCFHGKHLIAFKKMHFHSDRGSSGDTYSLLPGSETTHRLFPISRWPLITLFLQCLSGIPLSSKGNDFQS